jgi:flagellar basal body rod protein FlgG
LNFTIGHNGQVTENGVFDGQTLRVVRVADTSGLQDAGGGLFTVADPNIAQPTPLIEGEIALQQFHLEQSNVSTIREMTQMIQAMRSSELNHQVIRHYDQRLGKTIADLGQPL